MDLMQSYTCRATHADPHMQSYTFESTHSCFVAKQWQSPTAIPPFGHGPAVLQSCTFESTHHSCFECQNVADTLIKLTFWPWTCCAARPMLAGREKMAGGSESG
eukprot:scaffold253699_cov22-Tisochrysis_lutea.AAC.3